MKLPISVIILTFNEEKNIEACLRSVIDFADDVFIVDSFSNDKTLEIAKKYTDKVFQHKFENQAKQLNWALENLPIKTEWMLRIDADERVLPELKEELIVKLPKVKENVNGIYFKRRVFFWGKWIKHGGYYPTWLLRIWRHKRAYCEDRLVDEHMKLIEGGVEFLENDIYEENKKSLTLWIEKHNSYATREAIETLNLKYDIFKIKSVQGSLNGTQVQKRRYVKENLYGKAPLFLRVFLYFIFRYIFKLGFLDGKEGLIFHFLQGFWYRFLVDAKIYEIEKKAKESGKPIKQIISDLHNITL
ncbi:MAG: glycosyltransferase family 2 protein [Elusimicrobia bacterium]|nr:glycosyltransferase family 2 protein [Elusimicrobiota bacterium]